MESGTVKLAGIETDVIYKMATELLTYKEKYNAMAKAVNPYGDGKSCERILDILFNYFNK